MISLWNVIILSGVAAAALVSIGNKRYLAWLGAVLASYVASVVYWDFHSPYPEFFAAACDLAIVISVAWKARYIWELWFGLMFLISGFVNWLYLANNVTQSQLIGHATYSTILEIINIAAISLIGGVASFDKAGMINGVAFRPWLHIFGRVRPVYSRNNPSG